MPFVVPLDEARREFPQFTFISALTPSTQKAAFHVRDEDGNDLCLKIISPHHSMDERFQREVQFLQSINHPNIAKLIEYTFSSRPGEYRHYVVEEFIEGNDLTDKLQSGQQWSTSEASSFFPELSDGLFECYKKGVVHRDLKPSNIRVKPDNTPVIIDFGLARHLKLPDITGTSEGAAIGTRTYFAPEQWQGTKYDIDHRTDLFALGILLYLAIIGSHPFYQSGMSERELCDATCNSNDCLLAQRYLALPDQWKLILERLLKKDRGERPNNAGQVGTILRRIGGI